MAIGKELVSAYSGPADVDSFGDLGKVSETKTDKIQYSESDNKLYEMYDDVRRSRVEKTVTEEKMMIIFETLKSEYTTDWLLSLELYELALANNYSIKNELKNYLEELKSNKSYRALIENGLNLLSEQ
jgi:phenylalanine-4-hydroxylase